tara:strand:+ start:1643 stop:2596 length:954 start_codon:yes stop_codon:yes gene_type:complete
MKIRSALAGLLLASSNVAFAHDAPPTPEPMSLDELSGAFGWSFDTEITTESVTDDLHVLFGVGGNIVVSVGDDGVLIVDDQFPQMMKKIKRAIRKLGGKKVDMAITTHWHFDHAEGNLTLGPEGTWLVAQKNSRDMMADDHVIDLVGVSYLQKAYPESAWPDITYDTTMQLHMNGEQVDLMHFGAAHTTGDTAVWFRTSNAVHMGDVFNNSGYPFIDFGNGGSIDGVIAFCEGVLDAIEEDTVVIPGHGPLATYADMAAYVDMLKTIRARIVKLVQAGASLAEIQAAGVTREYDEKQGDPAMLVNRAYMSLTHKHVQ